MNKTEALRVYISSKKRDASSCNRLGWFYDAVVCWCHLEQSAKWYRLAADKGYPGAQNWLGNQYFDGTLVERDG